MSRHSNSIAQLQQSFIEFAVLKALPYLDAETANKEIIRLTIENMQLRAQIDAAAIQEVPNEPKI